MICLTVLYPNEPGAWFDYDYYVEKHVPMDLGLLPPLAEPLPPGRSRWEVLRGVDGPNGMKSPFLCIGRMWLNNVEEFLIFAGNAGAKADMDKYTNVMPLLFFGEAYG